MSDTSRPILDLRKAPQSGDIFQLGENEYITIISVRPGEVRYALGAIEVNMGRDTSEDQLRTSLVMPYGMFRKWLATIAAGKRMDTPPPA